MWTLIVHLAIGSKGNSVVFWRILILPSILYWETLRVKGKQNRYFKGSVIKCFAVKVELIVK